MKVIVFVWVAVSFIQSVFGQELGFKIHSDHSVTFTFKAPQAKVVQVSGSMFSQYNQVKTPIGSFTRETKKKMRKQGEFWTYTTKPLVSDLYTYRFFVDETTISLDSSNPNIVRDIDNELNYFIIPGGLADYYITQDVAHGKLVHAWYPSSLNGMKQRRMSVYLPPSYDLGNAAYPVLYLLHGSGGDEDAWTGCGRVMQILDNLINKGLCHPMIVVMPNGNVTLAAAPGADPNNPHVQPSGNNIPSMFGKFEKLFVSEIVNFVDKNYRTIKSKDSRAIAGLSLGGLHTLYISLNNPDLFNYVGLFSAQTSNALNNKRINRIRGINNTWDDIKSILPIVSNRGLDNQISSLTEGANNGDLEVYENLEEKLKSQFANPPKLYYIAVGKDDFTKKLNDDFRELLDSYGFQYYYNETDGGHTWDNWRRYLVDFAPRIFK